VIFGLGAALGWGLADLFAAVSGRRIGSWATVVIAQLSSALLIGLAFLLARPGDPKRNSTRYGSSSEPRQ